MSNLTNEELNQAQTAHATLVREVFIPVFLEKLANDFNIVPQNDEEVSSLLEMAARLGEASTQQSVKSASNQTNILKLANNQLNGLMTGTNNNYNGISSAVKQASYELAARPDLVDAVLTYHGAIAKQVSA
jgi:hypothetical protein